MINLFENFGQKDLDLAKSLYMAGIEHPTVVMNYSGFLPPEVESPFEYYIDQNSEGKARYFNQIKHPDLWEIRGNNNVGEVYEIDKKRANIIYTEPKHLRLVERVEWLNETGKIRSIDHYDSHGNLFAETVCDNEGTQLLQTFFDANGKEKILRDFTTNRITLKLDKDEIIFDSLVDFVVYYLKERGYDKDSIYYNSLSLPLFVSLQLANTGKENGILFWSEDVGQEIPGNMAYLLNNNTRTKKIIIQRKEVYNKVINMLPDDKKDMVSYLGTIYPHNRLNKQRKNILIMTNSDQIEHLKELVENLEGFHFYIGALTEMSSKLLAFDEYSNVTLYPSIVPEISEDLFEKCDIYLDINYGNEILGITRVAFRENMLILAFDSTVHNRTFVAPENIYKPDLYMKMTDKIRHAFSDEDMLQDLLYKQRVAADDETVPNYKKVLSK
ncbi:accessory Sec system glycosylation chaperone GtfB [Lactobacillus salivarius]|uniref:UDP-N-acetylglucosamine--peptide N-acetylglucosaminyltransferase stabilizing protein GtfB n=1 Tax=Ligilactobacillus salivarius TaxID=1624 RepID=A0A6A8LT52_9LACO|nr:accessory Sec system glycosylation chaperone GtfB [Ligilactobacillus salivarius]MSE07028.1 accessory Sec system glycosylation chaperone GtfB [Ligilactobacillus salivarius]MSE07644.1 accessory Sec system glycosylation chaperone GtfB [Ligilactobacillus salivarius]